MYIAAVALLAYAKVKSFVVIVIICLFSFSDSILSTGRAEVRITMETDNNEILLDSDDDFVPSGRRSSRKRTSVERFGVKAVSSTSKNNFDDKLVNLNEKATSSPSLNDSKSKMKPSILDEKKVSNLLKDTASKSNKNGHVKVKNNTPPAATDARAAMRKKLTDNWNRVKSQNQTAKTTTTTFKNSKPRSDLVVLDSDDDDFIPEPASKASKKKSIEDEFDFSFLNIKSSKTSNSSRESSRFTRNSSRTSLNESMFSTKSGDSSTIELEDEEGDELERELAKVDKLKLELDSKTASVTKKNSVAKPSPLPASKAPSGSIVQINFANLSAKKNASLVKKDKTEKSIVKEKKIVVPKVIETGPIDCFDDLIVQTTLGFPCNFCDKKMMFKKRREMINHLQLEHEEELTAAQQNRELAGVFSCDVCTSTFHSKHILKTHIKAHRKMNGKAICDNYYKFYLNVRVL